MARREMSKAEIDMLLATALVGVLGTVNTDGSPHLTPLNYLHHNNCIYFHCALTGRKLDNIASDPRVSFQVNELVHLLTDRELACDCSAKYRSVTVDGTAELVADGEDKTQLLLALSERYTKSSLEPPTITRSAGTGLVRITITKLHSKTNVSE